MSRDKDMPRRPSHRVMQRCAEALDGLSVPRGYDANIVLVNRGDPKAHMLVGKSDPRDLLQAIGDLLADQGEVGIVNAVKGVEISL